MFHGVVMMWRRAGFALAVPKIAVLLLSVAQDGEENLLRIGQAEVPGDLAAGLPPARRPSAGPARTSSWD